MSDETIEQIAARCLDDPEFAQSVLSGDTYPEVREAIVADLYGTDATGSEVEAFGVTYAETQPDEYMRIPTEFDASIWEALPRPQLNGLARRSF